MKLGKETGSVMNHIYSRMTIGQPEPVEGMGVTFLHWTDRSAGTIVWVEPNACGKHLTIGVQADHCKRTDRNGFSESQTYEYSRNPDGAITTWRFRNGRWEQIQVNQKSGRWIKMHGSGLRIGDRDAYWDPCF